MRESAKSRVRRHGRTGPCIVWAFVCVLPFVVACGMFQSGLGHAQAPLATVTPTVLTLARRALETYFALLHTGQYAEAVAYYGGDYQVLRDWNPNVARDDYASLLENGCTQNGLQCLPLHEIVVQVEQPPAEYHFMVRFVDHDGNTVVRPLLPSGGSGELSRDQFAYTVLKKDDRFLVQELPVYPVQGPLSGLPSLWHGPLAHSRSPAFPICRGREHPQL